MPRPEESPSSHLPAPTQHWVIAGASSQSEPCLQTLGTMPELPHLRALLNTLDEVDRVTGDEYALNMPHERLLARAWGWPEADGLVPWSAWWAAQDGVTLAGGQAWALLSPGHWLMGRDHLTLLDPATLGLSDDESRALLEIVRPLFEEDGWTLQWGTAQRWYAAHPSLNDYPSASLDRVVGRNPDVWLTDHPQARGVRRLQSEVQMLLYQHPVNDAREAQGLLSINSFWLSGAGRLPTGWSDAPSGPRLIDTLKPALLGDDMPGWLQALEALDNTVLAEVATLVEAGEPVRLTLCGERSAISWASGLPAKPGALSRLRGRFKLADATPRVGEQGQLHSASFMVLSAKNAFINGPLHSTHTSFQAVTPAGPRLICCIAAPG